jgi:DNA repair exonuclease SbcCD ATPase subunit
MSTARVSSIDALRGFREAWCQFLATARESLISMDGDIRHGRTAIEQNLAAWQRTLVILERKVVDARLELNRRKLGRAHGRPVDTSVEEEALRKAQRRFQEAEEKVAAAKKWLPRLEKAVFEYQGPKQQLMVLLETDMERGTAFLDQKLDALDLYTTTAPPEVAAPPPVLAPERLP